MIQIRSSLVLVLALGLGGWLWPGSTEAATSLSLSPARVLLTVHDSETASQPFELANNGEVPVTVTLKWYDIAEDATTLTFLEPGSQADSLQQLSPEVPPPTLLEPHATQTVWVSFQPFSKKYLGALRGALFASIESPADQSAVQVVPSVGSIVLVTLASPSKATRRSPRWWFDRIGISLVVLGLGVLLTVESYRHRRRG